MNLAEAEDRRLGDEAVGGVKFKLKRKTSFEGFILTINELGGGTGFDFYTSGVDGMGDKTLFGKSVVLAEVGEGGTVEDGVGIFLGHTGYYRSSGLIMQDGVTLPLIPQTGVGEQKVTPPRSPS